MTDPIQDFNARNGEPIPVGNRWLFPTGACQDGSALRDPPEDGLERLAARRMYWEARLDRVEDDLSKLRTALAGQGPPFTWPEKTYGPDPGSEEAAVKRLMTLQREARDRLEIIDGDIDALTPQEPVIPIPRRETFLEFRARHGNDCVVVNGRRIFSDGATSNGFDHDEPPEEREALIELQLEYMRARLADEERRFKSIQTYIHEQSEFHKMGAGPLPTEESFAAFRLLRAKILRLRRTIRETDAELSELRGPTALELQQKEIAHQQIAADRATAIAANLSI